MLDLYREATTGQFLAALQTLEAAIAQADDATWDGPVVNLTFNQAVFHALFFADVYLGENLALLKSQPFHQEHAAEFAGYEELERREQTASYSRRFIQAYVEHVRQKAHQVLAEEDEAQLARRPGFDWLDLPRAEVHLYNARHLQHHAAQLSLRLRLDSGDGVKWVRHGD